jgi:hypothetical protein
VECHRETVASNKQREQRELALLAVIGVVGAVGLAKVTLDFRRSLQACRRRPPDEESPA